MLRIVIYEDDQATRALLQEWLREAGYRVRIGTSCAAGDPDPVDVVIASVYMPKQRGAECVRDVQVAHPGRPVIAISCQFRPGLAAAGATARTLGVEQVIAKPLRRDELLRAVRDIAESSN